MSRMKTLSVQAVRPPADESLVQCGVCAACNRAPHVPPRRYDYAITAYRDVAGARLDGLDVELHAE